MLRIGLTGGIGSGKSTVEALFRELGVPVLDADQVARELVAPGSELFDRIREHFGESILAPDGELDRARLRRRVFANPGERRWLEALLHPEVRARMAAWAEAQLHPYVVLSIPLLFESGMQDLVDRILVVVCDPQTRIRRVCRRDGIPPEEVEAMLRSQWTDEKRRSLADDVIENQGDLEALRREVERLHRRYLTLAGAR
ncbi:MAG: dephospho-CoA kinase [Gammaproteobacteria bacterium]|nr:MAG: dephospho-CoA kinase [Gammaproteobacteria bacterium]